MDLKTILNSINVGGNGVEPVSTNLDLNSQDNTNDRELKKKAAAIAINNLAAKGSSYDESYNIDSNTLKKLNKHNISIIADDEDDYRKALAEKQSNFDRLGNSISRTIVNEMGLGTLKGVVDLFDLVFKVALGPEKVGYQSEASAAIQNWQERYEENVAPIYRRKPNETWGDFGWWMEQFPSVASTVALLLPSAGASAVVRGVEKGIGKIAGTAINAARNAKAVEIAAARGINHIDDFSDLSRFYNRSRKIVNESTNTIAKPIAQNNLAKLTAKDINFINRTNKLTPSARTEEVLGGLQDWILTGVGQRGIENYQEAQQVYNEQKETLKRVLSDKNQYDDFVNRTPEYAGWSVDNIAEDIANKAAKKTFTIDWANIVFDLVQLAALRGAWNFGNKIPSYKDIKARSLAAKYLGKTKSEIDEIEKGVKGITKFGRNAGYFAKSSGLVAAAEATEGIEEGVNYIAQQEGLYLGNKLFTGKDEVSPSDRVSSYLHSSGLWESAFWGWMGGIVFQGIGSGVGKLKTQLKASEKAEKAKREDSIYNWNKTFNEYANQIKLINGDENNPGVNPFVRGTDGKYIAIEDESERNELLKYAERRFSQSIAANAIADGTYKPFRAFLQDENLKQGLVELGVVKDANEAEEWSRNNLAYAQETADGFNTIMTRLTKAGLNRAQAFYLVSDNLNHFLDRNNYDRFVNHLDNKINKTLEDNSSLRDIFTEDAITAIKAQVYNEKLSLAYDRLHKLDGNNTADGIYRREKIKKEIDYIENQLSLSLASNTVDTNGILTVADYVKLFSKKKRTYDKDGSVNVQESDDYTKYIDELIEKNNPTGITEEERKAKVFYIKNAERNYNVEEGTLLFTAKGITNKLENDLKNASSSLYDDYYSKFTNEYLRNAEAAQIIETDEDARNAAREFNDRIDEKRKDDLNKYIRHINNMMKKYDEDVVYNYINQSIEGKSVKIDGITPQEQKELDDAILALELSDKTNTINIGKLDAIRKEIKYNKLAEARERLIEEEEKRKSETKEEETEEEIEEEVKENKDDEKTTLNLKDLSANFVVDGVEEISQLFTNNSSEESKAPASNTLSKIDNIRKFENDIDIISETAIRENQTIRNEAFNESKNEDEFVEKFTLKVIAEVEKEIDNKLKEEEKVLDDSVKNFIKETIGSVTYSARRIYRQKNNPTTEQKFSKIVSLAINRSTLLDANTLIFTAALTDSDNEEVKNNAKNAKKALNEIINDYLNSINATIIDGKSYISFEALRRYIYSLEEDENGVAVTDDLKGLTYEVMKAYFVYEANKQDSKYIITDYDKIDDKNLDKRALASSKDDNGLDSQINDEHLIDRRLRIDIHTIDEEAAKTDPKLVKSVHRNLDDVPLNAKLILRPTGVTGRYGIYVADKIKTNEDNVEDLSEAMLGTITVPLPIYNKNNEIVGYSQRNDYIKYDLYSNADSNKSKIIKFLTDLLNYDSETSTNDEKSFYNSLIQLAYNKKLKPEEKDLIIESIKNNSVFEEFYNSDIVDRSKEDVKGIVINHLVKFLQYTDIIRYNSNKEKYNKKKVQLVNTWINNLKASYESLIELDKQFNAKLNDNNEDGEYFDANYDIILTDVSEGELIHLNKENNDQPIKLSELPKPPVDDKLRIAASIKDDELTISGNGVINADGFLRGSTFVVYPTRNGKNAYIHLWSAPIEKDNGFVKSIIRGLKYGKPSVIDLFGDKTHIGILRKKGSYNIPDPRIDTDTISIAGTKIDKKADNFEEKVIELLNKHYRFNLNFEEITKDKDRNDNNKYSISIGGDTYVYESYSDFVIDNDLFRAGTVPQKTDYDSKKTTIFRRIGNNQLANQVLYFTISKKENISDSKTNEETSEFNRKFSKANDVINLVNKVLNGNEAKSKEDIIKLIREISNNKDFVDNLINLVDKGFAILPDSAIFDFNETAYNGKYEAPTKTSPERFTFTKAWAEEVANNPVTGIMILVHEQIHKLLNGVDNDKFRKSIAGCYLDFVNVIENINNISDDIISNDTKNRILKNLSIYEQYKFDNDAFTKESETNPSFEINGKRVYLDQLEEFLVESLTSPYLVPILNEIKSSSVSKGNIENELKGDKKETLFARILNALRNLFGIRLNKTSILREEIFALARANINTSENKIEFKSENQLEINFNEEEISISDVDNNENDEVHTYTNGDVFNDNNEFDEFNPDDIDMDESYMYDSDENGMNDNNISSIKNDKTSNNNSNSHYSRISTILTDDGKISFSQFLRIAPLENQAVLSRLYERGEIKIVCTIK